MPANHPSPRGGEGREKEQKGKLIHLLTGFLSRALFPSLAMAAQERHRCVITSGQKDLPRAGLGASSLLRIVHTLSTSLPASVSTLWNYEAICPFPRSQPLLLTSDMFRRPWVSPAPLVHSLGCSNGCSSRPSMRIPHSSQRKILPEGRSSVDL